MTAIYFSSVDRAQTLYFCWQQCFMFSMLAFYINNETKRRNWFCFLWNLYFLENKVSFRMKNKLSRTSKRYYSIKLKIYFLGKMRRCRKQKKIIIASNVFAFTVYVYWYFHIAQKITLLDRQYHFTAIAVNVFHIILSLHSSPL